MSNYLDFDDPGLVPPGPPTPADRVWFLAIAAMIVAVYLAACLVGWLIGD